MCLSMCVLKLEVDEGCLPQPLHFETGFLFEAEAWCLSYAAWSAMGSTCPHSYPEMLEHTLLFQGFWGFKPSPRAFIESIFLMNHHRTPAFSSLSVGNSNYQRLSHRKAGRLHLFTLYLHAPSHPPSLPSWFKGVPLCNIQTSIQFILGDGWHCPAPAGVFLL